jgi:hypothetical protein
VLKAVHVAALAKKLKVATHLRVRSKTLLRLQDALVDRPEESFVGRELRLVQRDDINANVQRFLASSPIRRGSGRRPSFQPR